MLRWTRAAPAAGGAIDGAAATPVVAMQLSLRGVGHDPLSGAYSLRDAQLGIGEGGLFGVIFRFFHQAPPPAGAERPSRGAISGVGLGDENGGPERVQAGLDAVPLV